MLGLTLPACAKEVCKTGSPSTLLFVYSFLVCRAVLVGSNYMEDQNIMDMCMLEPLELLQLWPPLVPSTLLHGGSTASWELYASDSGCFAQTPLSWAEMP